MQNPSNGRAQDRKPRRNFSNVFQILYPFHYRFSDIIIAVYKRFGIVFDTVVILAPPRISTPVSIVRNWKWCETRGIKGREIMEELGKIKVRHLIRQALTIGKPMVNRVKAYEMREEELLRIAAIAKLILNIPQGKRSWIGQKGYRKSRKHRKKRRSLPVRTEGCY